MSLSPLPVEFYARPVLEVTRALLGVRLVRVIDGQRLSGIIIETEAYVGESDLACHARAGRTPRTEVMYGTPGRAYVYFIYGMHWMFNVVAEEEGVPGAVLVRALLPAEGLEHISARREGRPPDEWTNGPARLCEAMEITGEQNGVDLTSHASGLFIEPGEEVPERLILRGPRVGIDNVPEPWRSKPWRLRVERKEWEAWKAAR